MTKNKIDKKAEVNQIRKMRDKYMSDQEILDSLKITESKYRHYKEELFKQDKRVLGELVSDNLAAEIIAMIRAYHKAIDKCDEIVDKSSTSFEILESLRLKILCHQEIVRSLANSPSMFAAVIGTPAFKDMLLQSDAKFQPDKVSFDIKIDNDEAIAP